MIIMEPMILTGWIYDGLQLSQRAALRAILVSNSIFPSEAPMHDSPQWHRIHSSDTAALWLLGLAFTSVHFVAGARYGFHRDELLTYSNARDLEWGYVVYPPVTAFLARIELAFFGTSLIGFRFFAAIASGFVAVLTGFMARAMGGGCQAMLVLAFAASIGGPYSSPARSCPRCRSICCGGSGWPGASRGCFRATTRAGGSASGPPSGLD
jgi:hypothetical protein